MHERLKKIELRAKALGWRCETVIEGTKDHPHYVVKFWVVKDVPEFDDWLVLTGNTAAEAAERLLSFYEDGPVIPLKLAPNSSWYDLDRDEVMEFMQVERGEGDFKLVRWDDAE